jgi:hypothetical protein
VQQWVARPDDLAIDLKTASPEDTEGADGFVAAAPGTAVAFRRAGERSWAVTIAVDVIERHRGQVMPPVTWFVEVGIVADSAGDLAVAGAPGLVAGPPSTAPGDGQSLSWRTPSPADPTVATVAGFGAALLTGTGDVSRYLAPGVELDAIDPAPFASVVVDRWAITRSDSRSMQARVVLDATTASGTPMAVSYALDLRQRDGRWEVARASGAPWGAAGVPTPASTAPSTVSSPGA